MSTLANCRRRGNHSFDAVIEPFLNESGLPFGRMLSAEAIERVFAERDALFGQHEIYSTQLVLWAFLAQVLQDGKGSACSSAVANIAAYAHQMDLPVPSGDTGDYCRARAKLNPAALRELVVQTADQLEADARPQWGWCGLHPKLVDGFTFTMMDTPSNQARFPQVGDQKPGAGFPIARACVILSLATAAVHDLAIAPYQGKQTGEPALLRRMLDHFDEGDLAVFDRCFASYWMLALLDGRGAQVCTRLHQRRKVDFRKGKRLGKYDHLVTWQRPRRPAWMSEAQYAQIPQTMTLRQLRFTITEPGRRPQSITVVTTLTDPQAYPKQQIAELYNYRWNVELDIRSIKQTLGMDFIPCKSPAMVQRHLWVTLLAYNLIRKLIVTAAVVHQKQPRQLSFTLACQQVLTWWMLLSTGACRDGPAVWKQILQHIAAQPVANRPGRVEPRAVKRRPKHYSRLNQPRRILKEKLMSK
jgi:hypothetical protein